MASRRTELGIPRLTEPFTYALTKAVIVEFCSMVSAAPPWPDMPQCLLSDIFT
jgi:hypothetical protein